MFSFINRRWLRIRNEFGGDFLVSESGIKYFYVGVTNIPKEACVALATYDWGNTSSSGLIALGVAGFWVSGETFNYTSEANADNYDNIYYSSYRTGCRSRTLPDQYYPAVACSGDSTNPIPMSVSNAAEACDCSSENICSVFLVYK